MLLIYYKYNTFVFLVVNIFIKYISYYYICITLCYYFCFFRQKFTF